MPHERKRHILDALKRTLGTSPLVGVLGHRQVGKTTLLNQVASHYLSLDVPEIHARAAALPTRFLSDLPKGLIALDECQTTPEIFPSLKEYVRTHPKPGRFLLSGSVRFTSKKSIRESLTGRILFHELFPMTVSELAQEPFSTRAMQLLHAPDFRRTDSLLPQTLLSAKRRKDFESYLKTGGLPGVCMIRNERIRANKFEDQLMTLLDRDLRQVHATSLPYPTIRGLLRELALLQGNPLDWTQLAKSSGITVVTLKKLMFALESVFIIRPVRIEGGRSGQTLFFEDLGEWRHVLDSETPDTMLLLHFVFTHLRTQWEYSLEKRYEHFQFRTRHGTSIPLALRSGEDILGFLPIVDEAPSKAELAAADSFLKHYSRSKVILLARGQREFRNARVAVLDPLFLV